MALKDKFLNGRGLYSLMDKIKSFVKPNQQTSGGETNLTSLEVNGTNYTVPQGTSVVVNPTIPSGTTPTALSNIEIDSNYYSIYKAVTATLISTNWSSNTQTVTVNGVTSANNVIVAPAPASVGDYASSGIYCSAQGTNSLTFTCDTAPVNNITVNVMIVG